MSDSQHTRVVRLAADVDREDAHNGRTYVSREIERVVLVDQRSLFNHHQRRIHQVLREFAEPGVAVFALHAQKGIAGRMWLAATDVVRAGTIGRHSEVDLYLPHDEELSLRHLLVMVRLCRPNNLGLRGEPPDLTLRIQVLDLATPGGFQAEQGGVLRAVDANGALILRAAGYSLFLFPTGGALPWNPDSADPWLTLPPRFLVADERLRVRHRSRRASGSPHETTISFCDGPTEPGPEPLLQAGERLEGHLELSNAGTATRFEVGARALERGIILGRYSRCTGDTLVMSDDVSRVHVMLVRVEGELHIVDTASTNGTKTNGREVKCEPVRPGLTYHLGRMRARWYPTH